jgi:hypothetical protein
MKVTIAFKISQFLQTNPGKWYSSQEISSNIGERNQSVSGILSNLCKNKQRKVQKNQEHPAKYSWIDVTHNAQFQNSNHADAIDKLREQLRNLDIKEDNIKKEKNRIQTALEVIQKL